MSEYDSPWKEALEEYFHAFMLFLFPGIASDIDWSRGFQWLDKELQQIAPQSETGRRTVDKLAKLWRKDGQEEWVLVHVEIQSQVVLAHLKAMETRHDPHSRQAWKVRLIKGLYERGFSRDDIRKLFRLIDWLMELPEDLSELFWDEIAQFEEERSMPYITSVERIGEKRGLEIGEKRGLSKGELIGRIHLCQRRLGVETTPTEELAELPTDQLQKQAERLETELFGS